MTLIQFDAGSGGRIADVVRYVESEANRRKPLTFAPILQSRAKSETQFRVAMFTGAWNKNATKTLTLANKTSTPNTVSATNLLYGIPQSNDTANSTMCVIGKEGTAWYFVNDEQDCGKSKSAQWLCESGFNSSSNAGELASGGGPQVLVNDSGCLKWVGLSKKRLTIALKSDNAGGLQWSEKEMYLLDVPGDATPVGVGCDNIGTNITGGSVAINHGSGSVAIVGNCRQKSINVNITLDTTNCPV